MDSFVKQVCDFVYSLYGGRDKNVIDNINLKQNIHTIISQTNLWFDVVIFFFNGKGFKFKFDFERKLMLFENYRSLNLRIGPTCLP
jgi:hypothetical protein